MAKGFYTFARSCSLAQERERWIMRGLGLGARSLLVVKSNIDLYRGDFWVLSGHLHSESNPTETVKFWACNKWGLCGSPTRRTPLGQAHCILGF